MGRHATRPLTPISGASNSPDATIKRLALTSNRIPVDCAARGGAPKPSAPTRATPKTYRILCVTCGPAADKTKLIGHIVKHGQAWAGQIAHLAARKKVGESSGPIDIDPRHHDPRSDEVPAQLCPDEPGLRPTGPGSGDPKRRARHYGGRPTRGQRGKLGTPQHEEYRARRRRRGHAAARSRANAGGVLYLN